MASDRQMEGQTEDIALSIGHHSINKAKSQCFISLNRSPYQYYVHGFGQTDGQRLTDGHLKEHITYLVHQIPLY